jgi:peptide/nickel transport system ATP-binding protein
MEYLVEVKDLTVRFRTDDGIVYAVNGANYSIPRGGTIGLVGESGCGKSVSANAIMQLLPDNGWVESGSVLYNSEAGSFDITKLDKRDKRSTLIHGKEMAMIFQEPMTSFCPVYTVGNQIIEAVRLHLDMPKNERRPYVIDLLKKVGIAKPERRIDEYPYQLSGGMRQRAMIAMAIAAHPKLIIADEPTTSLDVTIQAQILNLLKDLRQEYGMSMLMINHSFGIIAETCDVVAVMYLGYVIECAPTAEILNNPLHPYTRDLLRSVPKVTDKKGTKLNSIKGTVPGAYSLPPGCPYGDRCLSMQIGVCDREMPQMTGIDGHKIACHLYRSGKNSSPVARGEGRDNL